MSFEKLKMHARVCVCVCVCVCLHAYMYVCSGWHECKGVSVFKLEL